MLIISIYGLRFMPLFTHWMLRNHYIVHNGTTFILTLSATADFGGNDLVNNFLDLLAFFFSQVRERHVRLYNEMSLQFELGLLIRQSYGTDHRVEFERPSRYFQIQQALVKKEIDIAIYTPDFQQRFAIELKYPTQGQYPLQMFESLKDIRFLEQLVARGFTRGHFIFLAADHLFYEGNDLEGIYGYFRNGIPAAGLITNPINQQESIQLDGTYQVNWIPIDNDLKYSVVSIPNEMA